MSAMDTESGGDDQQQNNDPSNNKTNPLNNKVLDAVNMEQFNSYNIKQLFDLLLKQAESVQPVDYSILDDFGSKLAM